MEANGNTYMTGNLNVTGYASVQGKIYAGCQRLSTTSATGSGDVALSQACPAGTIVTGGGGSCGGTGHTMRDNFPQYDNGW